MKNPFRRFVAWLRDPVTATDEPPFTPTDYPPLEEPIPVEPEVKPVETPAPHKPKKSRAKRRKHP